MSSWPLSSDFARMLKTPQVAFRDPALRECAIELNQLGQPKPRSGNFATVYKALRPDGSEMAIRTFNRRSSDRRERYRLVSEYLEHRTLHSLVKFEYDERGIRSGSDGKFYPLVTMQWVPGVTLFEWARDRSREGYKEALAIAADVWLQVVRELAENGIVHGDLQHGNVMVSSEGYFKLVDYDCLGVPGLMGQLNLEIGMEPYQHPGRNADTQLFAGLDNFSALVIYVALRALAAAPHLWLTYVDNTGYDKLLFRREDFQNPNASPLYMELMQSPDEQVRDLTHYLMQLARYNLGDVPPVDEVLLWCNSLDDLLAARDWDMAVQLVQRMGPHEQIPAHLTQLVNEARQRVASRVALEKALAAGDEAAIQRAYVPQLLDDYPAAAQLVEKARQTTQVKHALELLKAAEQFQNWEVFKNTWMANQALLVGRKSAEPYKKQMQRIIATDTLRKMLKDATSDDAAIVQAWEYLQKLGGHPTAEALAPALAWRKQRHELHRKLREVIAARDGKPTLELDRKLVEVWKPNFFDNQPRFKEVLLEHRSAVTRLKKLRAYLELADQCTLESERKLAGALTELPDGYHPKLRQRCRQAMRRLKALQKIEQGIQDGAAIALIDARDSLAEADGLPLLSEEQQQRVEAARGRQPLLDKLSQVSHNWPPTQLDARLLEIWDEKLLADCKDADPWRATHQRAKQRKFVLEGLEQAIESLDLASIERLTADPCLRGYPLPGHVTQGIEDAKVRHQKQLVSRRQALVTALMEGDRSVFHELFDAKTLAEICRQYTHHQAVVGRLIEGEVLPLAKSGLALPDGDAFVRDPKHEDQFIARWRWPPAKFAAQCRLIVCANRPTPHTNPEDVPAVYSVSISRPQWHADGECHRIQSVPEWHNHHVLVWFNIDVGFQSFFSEPLELGTIAPLKKHKRWGLFG